MLVQLRRFASIVAVVLVGLAAVVFDPKAPAALALVCPPMSSLCNPTGLAVLAAGETGAAAGVTGTAAGTGVSLGSLGLGTAGAAAAGGAAVVTIKGWEASRLGTGDDVSWAGTVTRPPGWTATNSFSYSSAAGTGHVVVDVLSATIVQPATVRVNYSWTLHPESCVRGSAGGAFQVMAVADSVTGGSPVNTTGAFQRSGLGDTGGAPCKSTTGTETRDVPIAIGTGRVLTGFHLAVSGFSGSYPSSPGGLTYWYPGGNPDRPEDEVAGRGTLTQTIECKKADGTTRREDRVSAYTVVPNREFEVPPFMCGFDEVLIGYGASWMPAAGGAPVELVPWSPTAPWVQKIPTEYPNCITQVCNLDLRKKIAGSGGSTETCGNNAIACGDWYSDPAKKDNYQCQWGGYAVSLEACSTFRDPGRTLPNVTTQTTTDPATNQPRTTPTATPVDVMPDPSNDPVPGPGGSPTPAPTTEGGECFPKGWGVLNPIEWVYKPVKCALEDAFVPTVTQTKVDTIVQEIQTKTPVPQIGSIAGALQPPSGGSECLRLSLPLGFVLGHDQPLLDSCTWSDPVSQLLRDYRPFFSVVVWVVAIAPLAWWAWKQYAPGSTGTA